MNPKIEKLIKEIDTEEDFRSDNLQKPITKENYEALVNEVKSKYNYTFPKTYIEILFITDGISHNGIELYSSKTTNLGEYSDRFIDGIIEANDLFREYDPHKEYIFFAESGDDLYAHNLKENYFEITDKSCGDAVSRPLTEEEFFTMILENMLGIFPPEYDLYQFE